jgi:hypothetical protein
MYGIAHCLIDQDAWSVQNCADATFTPSARRR